MTADEARDASVKDLLFTRGVRTTMGSFIFADQVPGEDAVPVRRLREAGAILVGKTTTPEFGHKPLTDTPLFGDTAIRGSPSRQPARRSGRAAVRHLERSGAVVGTVEEDVSAFEHTFLVFFQGGLDAPSSRLRLSWLGRRHRAPQAPAFAQERFPFQWTRLIRHSRHPES